MAHVIAIQSTYDSVELGLFDGIQCLADQIIDKKDSSARLIQGIADLCSAQCWQLKDLTSIIANQGPGPFVTLRTVIASVNGLSFASGIPLIGTNALEALIIEFDADVRYNTLAILNAFGGEVYYAFRRAGSSEYDMGFGSVADACAHADGDDLHIIGNAVAMHRATLHSIYGSSITIHETILHASLRTVAHMGIKRIHSGDTGMHHLSPHYLKTDRSSQIK